MAESHWDATAGKIKDEKAYAEQVERDTADLNGFRAEKAIRDSAALTRPKKADEFKAEFSPDFKLPPGVDYKIDEADPLMAAYRQFALEREFDQPTFSKGLGLVAMIRANEAIAYQAAAKAEMAKLGAAAPNRVDACVQFLNAVGGPKAAALSNMFKVAPLADTIEAVENIMQRFQSQGITPFNRAHGAEPPGDGKIPGYDKMSFEQRRFAQDQQRARATR